MRIIPRSEWGARYGDGNGSRPLPASEAWLHHSVTIAPDLEQPYSDDYAAIRHIDDIGKDRFGWAYGFPYTFGITPVGLIFGGHHVAQQGAHTGGHNHEAIGIVFVGNYENQRPTEAQLNACAWLLRECRRRGWLKQARLNGGHRDLKATACPGKHAYAQIAEINRRAAAPERSWFDMATEADLRKAVKAELTAMREENIGAYMSGYPMTVEGAWYGGARYAAAAVNAITAEVRALAELLDVDLDALKAKADEILAAVEEADAPKA